MPTEEMERQRLRGPRTALEKKKKVRWWRVVIDVVTGLMVVSACLVCANLAYLNWTFNEPFYVNGMSMFPTLNADGKSGLKAIVAQCLASILRWEVSVIPEKLTQEKMFDVELYGLKTDEKKKVELSNKIENDSFLGYIVRAIKYASGIGE